LGRGGEGLNRQIEKIKKTQKTISRITGGSTRRKTSSSGDLCVFSRLVK